MELFECLNYGLSMDDLRLIESYIKRELHFIIRFAQGDSQEFVASFEADPQNLGSDLEVFRGYDFRIDRKTREACSEFISFAWKHTVERVRRRHCDQQPVLVENVQFMKTPERFPFPSPVWFDVIQNFYRDFPYSGFYSTSRSSVSLGAFADWKVYSPDTLRTSVGHLFAHEVDCKVIERNPHIVDGISDYQGEIRRDRKILGYIVNSLSQLYIVLWPDKFAVAPSKAIDSPFKVKDVIFGPVEF